MSLIIHGTFKGLNASKYGSGKQISSNSSGSVSRLRRSSGWNNDRAWQNRTSRDRDYEGFTKLNGSIAEAKSQGAVGHDVEVSGGSVGRGGRTEDAISLEAINLPEGVIQVQNEVDVTSHGWMEYKDKIY